MLFISCIEYWLCSICVAVMFSSKGFHYLICHNFLWLGKTDRVFDFFWKVYFSPNFLMKIFYCVDSQWNVVTWLDLLWHLTWYGACRELTTVMIILPNLMRIVDFLIVSGLTIGVIFIFCASTLEMWPTAFQAQSFHRFYLIDYRCFCGMEFSSGLPLALSYLALKPQILLKQSSIAFQ